MEDLLAAQHLVGVSGEQPDIFFRHFPPNLFQQRQKRLFIFLFAGFTAEYGNTLYPRGTQGINDFVFCFFGERLTVAEVPSLRIVTAFAVIPASGYKQRHTDTFAVCDIVFIQPAVVHRCITRSLISAVRP